MNIRLTNKERESLEWLQHFTNQLLQGEPVEYTGIRIIRLTPTAKSGFRSK